MSFKQGNDVEFFYSIADMNFTTSQDANWSKFDQILNKAWTNAKERGCFNYDLKVKVKTTEGPNQKYFLQLNHQRRTNRRKPHSFTSISAPFDSNLFNFTKAKPEERLFKIKSTASDNDNYAGEIDINANNLSTTPGDLVCCMSQSNSNYILVNSSPFSVGHSLILPQLFACRPQMLERKHVKLALEMQALSNDENFCIAYSSLCAGASINHLHLHCYYIPINGNQNDFKLIIQRSLTSLTSVSKTCLLCKDFPIPGFVFEITEKSQIDQVSIEASTLLSYFIKNEIAHNVCIVKAIKDTSDSSKKKNLVTRLIIWPRKSIIGAKCDDQLCPSICEVMGHILIPTEELLESLTEEQVTNFLLKFKLDEEKFNKVFTDIKNLLC